MTEQPPARLALVDALRGIAALTVVVYHFYWIRLRPLAEAPAPQPFDWLARQGSAGVDIFFVLSGYVIALSLRDKNITPGFLGRFALRRSLRLDPPYWITLVVVIVVNALTAAAPPPTLPSVVAHVVYLQYFLHLPPIVGVAWTLCLELQFYLVLAVVLAAAKNRERRALVVLVPLFVAACASTLVTLPRPLDASFLPYWHFFFLGALTSWTSSARVHPAWLAAALVVVAALFAYAPDANLVLAAATAVLLYAGAARGFLAWTGGRALQHLGRISYSLYLTHLVVAPLAMQLAANAWFAFPLAPGAVAALFALGVVVAVAVAHVFWRFVEAPAHRFSRRVTPI